MALAMRQEPGDCDLTSRVDPLKAAPQAPAKIFVSYASEDEPLLKELLAHLSLLERKGIVTVWHTGRIAAGSNRVVEASAHLQSADFVLLLLSPSYMADDICYETEMRVAIKMCESCISHIIPILLRPLDHWPDAPFGCIQMLPRDGRAVTSRPDRDDAWMDVSRSIRDALNRTSLTFPTATRGTDSRKTTRPSYWSILRTHRAALVLLLASASLFGAYPSVHRSEPISVVPTSSPPAEGVAVAPRTLDANPPPRSPEPLVAIPHAPSSNPTSYRGVLQDRDSSLPLKGANLFLSGVPSCQSITDDAGLFDFGHCDPISIARLMKKTAVLILPTGRRCPAVRLFEPPFVTSLEVDSECSFGERAMHAPKW